MNCVFVLEISNPGDVLKELAVFFQDRKIIIENLQLHRYFSGNAQVIIHCQLEKDRVRRTLHLLEQKPGILELQLMEGR